MKISGSTVLVTGGGTGIGRGLAESFHRLGNQVIVAGRRPEPLQAVAQDNPGINYLLLDQGDPADIRRFAAELAARYPDLDAVINNAGIQRVEDLSTGEVAAAEQTVAINLLGPIRVTAALLPLLLAKPRAAIVNVSSGLAFMPSALTPTYGATKAALHSYTQSLRFQLRNTSVQVIEIIPPQVHTQLKGERGFDSRAMPLEEYVSETMSLLQTQPQAAEILVDRVKLIRFAERDGIYDDIYSGLNARYRRDSDAQRIDQTSASD
jgi:uncharacterized oxidoreductase